MSITSSCTKQWFVASFEGAHTDKAWTNYAKVTGTFLRQCEPGALIIHVVKGAYASPGPKAQAHIAEAMQGAVCINNVCACAFIVDSVMARAALMAINWQAPKPFPEEVFGDPAMAWAWLSSRVESTRLREAWQCLALPKYVMDP